MTVPTVYKGQKQDQMRRALQASAASVQEPGQGILQRQGAELSANNSSGF